MVASGLHGDHQQPFFPVLGVEAAALPTVIQDPVRFHVPMRAGTGRHTPTVALACNALHPLTLYKRLDSMDTRTAKVDVSAQIEDIKRFMPETYAAIKDRAYTVGNEAFVQVRKGLRGEPNCFYAFERGRVVGTPFNVTDVMDVVAGNMVRFGCAHVCIWPMTSTEQPGATDGTH